MSENIFYCEFCNFQAVTLSAVRFHKMQFNHVFYCDPMIAQGYQQRPGACDKFFVTELGLIKHR